MTAEFFDAYLGLGANLGDRRATIDRALDRLRSLPGTEVVAVSKLIETDPVGGPADQPQYLNGAARLRTRLGPRALFECLKSIERDEGRPLGGERNGPRVLDLDLLIHSAGSVDSPDLVVPHPRMKGRAFVEEPLLELGVDQVPPAPEVPRVIEGVAEFQTLCRELRRGGHSIGLVPTMGALHVGHRALLERARVECTKVVMSLFVNPKQFGAHEDLDRYPRTLEHDLSVCREVGVDLVFLPDAGEMYPQGFCSDIATGTAGVGMEGDQRPGHFDGVATVVAKLFALTEPDRSYFGQKDAQQVAVLRRLSADLGLGGELVECPTVREDDGLALSSRNRYLDAEDRDAAPILHRAMQAVRTSYLDGERSKEHLLAIASDLLGAEPRLRLDYLELRHFEDLSAIDGDRLEDPEAQLYRMLVAGRFGSPPTRLLDNLILSR
ncbi:MAG: pantoate--beta-alanine ligase [Planctomycetota bacterium]